jgi:hypothetical protein
VRGASFTSRRRDPRWQAHRLSRQLSQLTAIGAACEVACADTAVIRKLLLTASVLSKLVSLVVRQKQPYSTVPATTDLPVQQTVLAQRTCV